MKKIIIAIQLLFLSSLAFGQVGIKCNGCSTTIVNQQGGVSQIGVNATGDTLIHNDGNGMETRIPLLAGINLTEIINNLSPVEQVEFCQAIVDSGCDFSSLVSLDSLIVNSTSNTFERLLDSIAANDIPLFHVSGQGVTGTGDAYVTAGDSIIFTSDDESIVIEVTQGSAKVDLQAVETITSLVNNNNGTFTYTNESNSPTTFRTGLVTTIGFTNADYDLLSFPPAQPNTAPATAGNGDTHIERYSNGYAYFTHNGTDWTLNLFQTEENEKFTHVEEYGTDYVDGSLAGPQNPPANPGQGDTHLEVYGNSMVFFRYQEFGPGAGWDGNNITYVPLGGGTGHPDDDVETVTGKEVNNADPRNPIVKAKIKEECYVFPINPQNLNGEGGSRNQRDIETLGDDFKQTYTATQDMLLDRWAGTFTSQGVTVNWKTPRASGSTSFGVVNAGQLNVPLSGMLYAGETLEFTYVNDSGNTNIWYNANNTFFNEEIVNGFSWEGRLYFSEVEKDIVRTYDDGTFCSVDKDGNTITALAAIPANYTLVDCKPDYVIKETVCYVEDNYSLISDNSGASGGDASIPQVLGQAGQGGRWTVPAGATYTELEAFGNHFFSGSDGDVVWEITNTTTGQVVSATTNYVTSAGTVGPVDLQSGAINFDGSVYTKLDAAINVSPGDVVHFIPVSSTANPTWRRSQPLGAADVADWGWITGGQVNRPSFALYTNEPIPHTVIRYKDINETAADIVEVDSVQGGTIGATWSIVSCVSQLDLDKIAEQDRYIIKQECLQEVIDESEVTNTVTLPSGVLAANTPLTMPSGAIINLSPIINSGAAAPSVVNAGQGNGLYNFGTDGIQYDLPTGVSEFSITYSESTDAVLFNVEPSSVSQGTVVAVVGGWEWTAPNGTVTFTNPPSQVTHISQGVGGTSDTVASLAITALGDKHEVWTYSDDYVTVDGVEGTPDPTWVACPEEGLNTTQVNEVQSLIDEALVCESEFTISNTAEPINAMTGTLSDGTTWTITNDQSPTATTSFATSGNGDIAWDNSSDITITFSNPVQVEVRPTTGNIAPIGNPIVWQLTNAGASTIFTNGDSLVYSPGVDDVMLSQPNPQQLEGTIQTTVALSPRANDPWGVVVAPNTTEIHFEARDLDAYNFTVKTISTDCSGEESLYPDPPTVDGVYQLTVTVTGGVPVYTWE